ncbi:hypothetical protein CASFOL_004371 [Castilleja foliolosa]|uniref:Uncharacterized protein n=1 Tax=Castilleja foliolosa TaxID=1961234 RepID=A0ABD3EE11_9LAMI
MSLVTDEIRATASETYTGDEMCQVKSRQLLTEMGLPNGLLPLQDMEECGYVKDTGFVWLRQKKKFDHKFEKIGRYVQYAKEVTAYVEPNKIKNLTGVKAKELLVWLNIGEIYIDEKRNDKITFRAPSGLSRTFPVSAFVVEEKEAAAVVVEEKEKEAVVVEEKEKEATAATVVVEDKIGGMNGVGVGVKEV